MLLSFCMKLLFLIRISRIRSEISDVSLSLSLSLLLVEMIDSALENAHLSRFDGSFSRYPRQTQIVPFSMIVTVADLTRMI